MKILKNVSLLLIAALFLLGCSSNDDDGGGGGGEEEQEQGQLPITFEVDPLLFRQYNVERPPSTNQFAAVYGFAVFTPQPTAEKYTLTYESTTSPNLNFTISWRNGEPIPTRGAPVSPNDIPGYNNGIVGGEYYIVILASGCEGPPGSTCEAGGETVNNLENNLRSIEGTVTVLIEFE